AGMSWLLAFAGFAALIMLHELGHFMAAKATGMRVERFSLFFPPHIFKWRPKGSETDYAIGIIPLGGYCKITGMTANEELPEDIAKQIATHRCAGTPTNGCSATTPAKLTIRRDGRLRTLTIVPRYDATAGIKRMRVGFSYADDKHVAPQNVVTAAGRSVSTM